MIFPILKEEIKAGGDIQNIGHERDNDSQDETQKSKSKYIYQNKKILFPSWRVFDTNSPFCGGRKTRIKPNQAQIQYQTVGSFA